MSFACKLQDAFDQNDVNKAVTIITDEKSSTSLVDRLAEVVTTELRKNEHKNVVLILRAIENLSDEDEEFIHRLVHHGLVVKMLSWFEIVSKHLKEHHKPSKIAVSLIEVFYEVSMSVCQITSTEENSKILDIFLLRFGSVVLDDEMPFCLRLEAIRTINSMLDSSPKDIRKKLCQSDDHIGLLEHLAKALVDIGDYEMQVAISEALCRMTPKKLREDFAGQWFSFRSFTSAFTSIRDKDFETDCRLFLNELNGYFGNSRRVFSLPCIRVFLDTFELFKPDDEFLKEFWVDFNIGTSTISFFVNDPQNTLWELIHLSEDAVSTYNLQDLDDQKILTVTMSIPINHRTITGQTVKIIFGSEHNVERALSRVFAKKIQLAPESVKSKEDFAFLEGKGTPQLKTFTSPSAGEIKYFRKRIRLNSYPGAKVSRTQDKDIFYFKDHSDSEVACAKAVSFCQSSSSNGSTKSLPSETLCKAVKKRKGGKNLEEFVRRDTPHFSYSRKKPKVHSKLRVLPLSSPSSNDEFSKYSTPKPRIYGKDREEREVLSSELKALRSVNFTFDSGFQDKTDSSFQMEEAENLVEKVQEQSLDMEESHTLESTQPYVETRTRDEQPQRLKPKRLFLSGSLESAIEGVSEVLGDESEEELGAGVRAAFNSFKTQLRSHFSNRYKRIEARSLQSLTDCQRNVTSLLGTVHSQRLLHLERFQNSVVQQLESLEQDCLTLKSIEKETVNFWQLEANTVQNFCNRQQTRLDSLSIPPETSSASNVPSDNQEANVNG